MMNEEEYLTGKMGRKNPFRVPEGYFDTLTAQVMAQLPEKPARQRRLRPWLYAAAFAGVAFVSAAIYFHQAVPSSQPLAQAGEYVATDASYADEVLDYAMMDNQDIYACLTSE